MTLYIDLKNYQPFNEQEEKDKELIMRMLEKEDIYTRENPVAHLSASAWVVNQDFTKVLMCYHNLYHSWSWLGGHADGERDLLKVAIKEVQEESGLVRVRPYDKQIFSVEALTVDGHEKHGKYVSSHLHLNVTYLLVGDENDDLRMKPDENAGVKWFTVSEALQASSEPWFIERIYQKLKIKTEKLRENQK